MPVTPEVVSQVAALAKLDMTDADLPAVTERFSRVLDMVASLHSIPTDGVMPMSNPHDMIQRLRDDVVTENDQRQSLLAVAPQSEAGYFLVPKVID